MMLTVGRLCSGTVGSGCGVAPTSCHTGWSCGRWEQDSCYTGWSCGVWEQDSCHTVLSDSCHTVLTAVTWVVWRYSVRGGCAGGTVPAWWHGRSQQLSHWWPGGAVVSRVICGSGSVVTVTAVILAVVVMMAQWSSRWWFGQGRRFTVQGTWRQWSYCRSWWCALCLYCRTVPDQGALKEAPTFPENADPEGAVAKMALQTSSLLALLNAQDLPGVSAKATKVRLGEGLGTVSKRTHDRMMKWEFIDLGELRTRTLAERRAVESDTERLVVLPGFEVSQAKKKPIADILTWVQCFSRYTAAMAKKFPESTPGFMSHMLVVLKAHAEVEEPAWRRYDIAFREKMAATGVRQWLGMDVKVYQEVCGGCPRKRAEPAGEKRGLPMGAKRPMEGRRPVVCWQFNDGSCTYGKSCRFPHICDTCKGNHSRVQWTWTRNGWPYCWQHNYVVHDTMLYTILLWEGDTIMGGVL